jgi:rhodanese-related sulfurtransferase
MNRIRIVLFFVALIIVTTELSAQKSSAQESITLEAFEQKLKQNSNPQILDVRSSQEFAENHLIGAINLSLSDDASFKTGIESLNKKKPVFIYSINNGRSGVVAEQLREQGFVEVYQLPGGIAHWLGAGKPVEAIATRGISEAEFKKLIAAKNLVLVDVGSKYCGGCKKLAPIVDALANEQGDLKIVKVELYDNRELADKLNIESVPTLILYKGSKVIWKKSGNITKVEIQEALDRSL